MRLSLAALSALPLLSLAASPQSTFSSPQVYLHPSPPSHSSSSPILSTEQAKAVLAHHLGHAHEFSLTEIVGDIGDWTRLMFGGGAQRVAGEGGEKSRVLVVQGVEDPSDFTRLSPSFTLSSDSSDSISSLLAPYLSRASTFLSHALSSLSLDKVELPNFLLDIFDLKNSEAAHALKTELSALTAWAEGLIPASSSTSDAGYEVMAVEGLQGVKKDGEEYGAASNLVKAAINSMTSSQTPFILILTPPSSSTPKQLVRRVDPTTPLPPPQSSSTGLPSNSTPNQNASFYPGPVFSTNLCLTSYEACTNYTDSCSGRGACGETKRGGKSCWTCSCRVENSKKYGRTKWSGVSCEKQDVSEAFVLIVFTVLLGFFLTVGSIGLLYSVGTIPLPSVLSAGAAPAGKN